LGDATQKRRFNLENMEQILESIETQHLDFAKRAAPFNNWMDSAMEDLEDMFIVHTIKEIKDLILAHDSFKQTLPDARQEKEGIIGILNNIKKVQEQYNLSDAVLENAYSSINPEELESKWNAVCELVPKRDQSLQQELTKQQNHDRLRSQFAVLANELGPWIKDKTHEISTVAMDLSGTLENVVNQLKEFQQRMDAYKPKMDELEGYNQQLQESLVFDNHLTAYTMEHLRVGWEHLKQTVAQTINEVENQILMRDAKGLTKDQMNEYRNSFQHFDRDENGTISSENFRGVLITQGLLDVTDQKEGEAEFQRIMSMVDPAGTGTVTFQSFIDFMTRENTDTDTKQQIVDSFTVLADNKPYITPAELRKELPADQAEYCISRMSKYEGPNAPEDALDYHSLASSLYGESDL